MDCSEVSVYAELSYIKVCFTNVGSETRYKDERDVTN